MYCTHCGSALAEDNNFCSGCGTSLSGGAPAQSPKRDWELHVNILGWLLIAYSSLTALAGLLVMFGGQILVRFLHENPQVIANANPDDVPPPEVLALIAPASFLIGIIFMLVALPSVAAGIGVLRHRQWGRVLTLITSFLRLIEFPFGTATAIYAFWVLLSDGGKSYYRKKSAQAEA